MSNQARISSIDALEAFRAGLIRYIEHARVALEDMTGHARRTRTQSPTAGNSPNARSAPEGSADASPPSSNSTRYFSCAPNDTRPRMRGLISILVRSVFKGLEHTAPAEPPGGRLNEEGAPAKRAG